MTQQFYSSIYPKELQNRYSTIHLHTNVHSNNIHNHQKLKIIQMFTNQLQTHFLSTNNSQPNVLLQQQKQAKKTPQKYPSVFSCKGILFIHKIRMKYWCMLQHESCILLHLLLSISKVLIFILVVEDLINFQYSKFQQFFGIIFSTLSKSLT